MVEQIGGNTTKVDHGRLFWAKDTAQWEERNLITTRTSQKRNNCIPGKKLAVINFEPFIESQLKTYLRLRCDTFAAACISHSLGAWKEITSYKEISTVMALKIDFDEPPKQQFLPACIRLAGEEEFVDLEVKKLLWKSVIEPMGHDHGEIISVVFVRSQKYGGHRMILNLKNLDQYANKLHFKMDTLNAITNLVDKDCLMASIGLKGRALFRANRCIGQEIPTLFLEGSTLSVYMLSQWLLMRAQKINQTS